MPEWDSGSQAGETQRGERFAFRGRKFQAAREKLVLDSVALYVLILQEPGGRLRRRRSTRGRHQKYSFSANCTSRGSPGPPEPAPRIGESVLETLPNDPGEFRLALGFAKFGWLKALKNSARNCSR